MSRRHMVLALASLPSMPLPVPARAPTVDDSEALSVLMLDAYRETVDADGSETIDDARTEIRGWFANGDLRPILEHSGVAVDAERVVSAVLVSRLGKVPVIAYVMTAADHKGRGLATGLILRTLHSLRVAGESHVRLWVTAGNPAERIYDRLGFRPEPAVVD